MKSFTLFAAAIFFFAQGLLAQVIDIADARQLPLGTVVTISGTVTNGQELGNIRYLQDHTGALSAFGPSVTDVLRHDSITVTGELFEFNGLLELSPVTNLVNHGPAVVQIQPTPVSLGDISEDTESMLVSVSSCVFADGGNDFVGNTTYPLTSVGQQGTAYIRADHPLVGDLIPVSPVDIVAISSQFSFTGQGGYQILPRDADDLSSPNPINIISAIGIEDLTENGFTLTWVTDQAATTECFYTSNLDAIGITDNQDGTMAPSTQHSLTLSNLEPGEVYYTRVFSVLDSDTAYSSIFAAATVSQSSGTIEVFFNGTVAHEVAEPEDNLAVQSNLRDKVLEIIGMAETSIDMAAYNINDNVIVNALNVAESNGVQVRYISTSQTANIALNNLSTSIPRLIRQDGQGSGMHNKFIVIDHESNDNSYVLTGSTNFTNNNLFQDFNNMVIIQDRALARAYHIEFNEMWGSIGPQPDVDNARFGAMKTNNTPKDFIIGGKDVKLYFSPSDGTTGGIIEALETANASVEFAMLAFTMSSIANTLVDLNNDFFITVEGIINNVNTTGSEFDFLNNNLVNVLHHNMGQLQLHHKYAIVDRANLNSDPLVITGSHNWSASANNVNDENTLVIYDADITNQFYQEYLARYQGLTVNTNEISLQEFKMFPNPASDRLNLHFAAPAGEQQISIHDLSGKRMMDYRFYAPAGLNEMALDTKNLARGVYILTLQGDWGVQSEKLIISR